MDDADSKQPERGPRFPLYAQVLVGVAVVWAGVADCGVVSVLGVLAGAALAADVLAGVKGCAGCDGCNAETDTAGRVWMATGAGVTVTAGAAGAEAT